MAKIEMIASDTVHVSSFQSDPLRAGDKFTVNSEEDAKTLEALGHKRAKVVPQVAAKPEPASARSKPAKRK